MTIDDAEETVAFLHEVGHLKSTPRAGWALAGVDRPESVAEHSFRVAVIAYVLALTEGCDAERAATIGLFHDVHETRTTDLHSVAKPWVAVEPDLDVAAAQTAGLPPMLELPIIGLVGEFGGQASPESRCAKDADRLECLLQAREYEARGNRLVRPWVESMLAAVVTEAGKRLAHAALGTAPDAWWHDIVASYGRPVAA